MPFCPLVSICIPSYNSASFIADTIRSALNQTYPNIEVIVSDDCSFDDTVKIVDTFSDPRVKLYRNERNLGVEGNWNRSMELASGIYLKVTGADDLLDSDCIQKQVSVFETTGNEGVVLVTCHKRVINKNGNEVITVRFPGKGRIKGLAALRKTIRRGTNLIGEPVAGLFKSETLKKSGVFDGKNVYLIDLDLWSRMLRFGELYVIDEFLYSFRISHESISASMGFKQFTLFNSFVAKLAADPKFQIRTTDKIAARMMSMIMVMARQILQLGYFIRK